MKKQTLIVGIMIAIGLIVGLSLWAVTFAQDNKQTEVTLKGEIVDMHCYITRGDKGPGHAGCAKACITRSVTPGFLAADGKLYVLLDEKPFSVKDKVADLAGQQSSLTGVIVERDGLRAIILKHIEAATQGQ